MSGVVEFFRRGVSLGAADFCEPQLNFLAHAQTLEINTGSRCGGQGSCGGDRVRIELGTGSRSEVSPPTELERLHLAADELASGIRLACQCFPNRPDLKLRLHFD